jgi:hypothetical protein
MTQFSDQYLHAWHRFMGKGMDFAQITKHDIAALSTHHETKLWYEQWRREEDKKQERAAKEEAARRPAPAAAPDPARARFRELVKADDKDLDKLIATMAEEFPGFTTPIALLHAVVRDVTAAVEDMDQKNARRNERLDALARGARAATGIKGRRSLANRSGLRRRRYRFASWRRVDLLTRSSRGGHRDQSRLLPAARDARPRRTGWARWNIDALREQLDADPRRTPETRAHIVETFWPQGHAAALQAITSGWRRLQQERADAP